MFARALALLLALACGPVMPVLDAVLFHGAGTSDLAKARVGATDAPLVHADACQLGASRAPISKPPGGAMAPAPACVDAVSLPATRVAARAMALRSELHSRAPPFTS